VLNRALAKLPTERYETAGALLQNFRTAVMARPTTPVPSQPLPPTVRVSHPLVGGSGPTTINPSSVISGPTVQPTAPQYSGVLPAPPQYSGVLPPTQQPSVQYSGVLSPAGVPPAPVVVPRPVAAAFPVQPRKPSIWTGGFTALFVLAVIAGAIDTQVFKDKQDAASIYWNFFVLFVLPGVISLVGSSFARPGLMRAGFIFQIFSAAAGSALIWLLLNFFTNPGPNFPDMLFAHLGLAFNLLNLLSLVCLSYALVRKHPSDGGLTALQVIASVILITIFWNKAQLGQSPTALTYETAATFACLVFPAALLVLRFRAWIQYPVAFLSLAAGQVLAVLTYFPDVFFTISSPDTLFEIEIASNVLAVLGFLVLAQIARMKKLGKIP
jgi:hypothetical protein